MNDDWKKDHVVDFSKPATVDGPKCSKCGALAYFTEAERTTHRYSLDESPFFVQECTVGCPKNGKRSQ